MTFTRYALFHLPPVSALARFGAAWLGWDNIAGCDRAPSEVAGLPIDLRKITRRPRKYGFHGTLKPPFRLAAGVTQQDLETAVTTFATNHKALTVGQMVLARMGGFLALVPDAPNKPLDALAAETVRHFDMFRAPMSDAELARRSQPHLTPAQTAHLLQWGYPYVLDQFRFHMTLSGHLGDACPTVQTVLAPLVAPYLAQPLTIGDICLLGEGLDGNFYLIHRAPLA